MSIDDFARAIGVGRSTQIRTEGGHRTPREEELRAMARVSGLPLEFFTVDDLAGTLSGDGDESAQARDAAVVDELGFGETHAYIELPRIG